MVDGEHPTRSAIAGADQPARYRPTGSSPSQTTGPAPGGPAVDAGGGQPAVHGLPADPIASGQIPQAQPAVPVEVGQLGVGRADTTAGSAGAPGDAPALKTEIHQARATAQLIRDLRRRVPPGVKPSDLVIADIAADRGPGSAVEAHRPRPARCAASG